MIERTDTPKLFRVEKSDRVDRRGAPEDYGFTPSNFFGGVEKMLDGDVLITSQTKQSAQHYGDTEFSGNYYLYEIDSEGLRSVSLTENVESNPQFTALRQGWEADHLERLRQEGTLNEFAEGAQKFGEVHLSCDGLTPDRIFRIPHP